MKRFVPETTLAMIALMFLGCSAPAESSNDTLPAGVHIASESGHETPELALRAFVTAWNSGDFVDVSRTFHPDRRGALESNRQEVESRLSRWRIEQPEVDTLCHPRGGGWKTSRFVRVDTDTDQVVVDAAWLRLGDRKWWMYSL